MCLLPNDPRVHPEERLRMRSHVDAGRVVVGLVLRPVADQRGVSLSRMDVVRQPGAVVEELRQPPETVRVRRCIRLSHHSAGSRLDGVLEQQPALAAGGDVAEALVVRADPVVGRSRGRQPALADVPALAYVVLVLLQSQPAARRQEVAGDPRRLEAEDPVALAEQALGEVTVGVVIALCHRTLPSTTAIERGSAIP